MQQSQGQDASQWFQQVVLPPILEPGEQFGTLGMVHMHNFPVSRPDRSTFWMFDGMLARGKPIDAGEQQALVALTSNRILIMPCAISGTGAAQHNTIYGVVTIRWAAIRNVIVPSKTGQKSFLNLEVRNPNRPAESIALKLYFWHKEDSVSTHQDFLARAGELATERAAAARANGTPEPSLFFEGPATTGAQPMPPPPPPPQPMQPMQPMQYGMPAPHGMPPMQYGMPYGNMPYGNMPYGNMSYGARRMSGMAITGFVLSFFCGLLGLIFSSIAMGQIKKSGGMLKGNGFAIAGLVISLVSILLNLFIVTARR